MGSDDATIVSAYYLIKSKLPSSKYEEYIKNFMYLDMKCVIATNNETYDKVFKEKYPETERRRYMIIEINDFKVSSYDWKKDYEMDHEKSVGHSPELYMVWAEKSFFLKRVIEENPYNTKYFFWNDIGLFRFPILLEQLKNYPNVKNIRDEYIYITLVNKFNENDFKNISVCDDRFRYRNTIAGGNFGGSYYVLMKFIKKYEETLNEFDRLGLFKGKDQSLYSWIIVRNPELFGLVNDSKYSQGPLSWFYLYIYLK